MALELTIVDRRARAAELLSIKGFMSLAELVQNLGVSESTIRRDLEILEEQGPIRRTHGGAVYIKDTPTHRLAFAERETSCAVEKKAIARAVLDLIPPGQTIILDGGTTCYEVFHSNKSLAPIRMDSRPRKADRVNGRPKAASQPNRSTRPCSDYRWDR